MSFSEMQWHRPLKKAIRSFLSTVCGPRKSPSVPAPSQQTQRVTGPEAFLARLDIEPALLNGVLLDWLEMVPIVDAIRARAGCNLLVFGCGNDSRFWEAVNRGGRTVFLEDDPHWASVTEKQLLQSQVFVVSYGTRTAEWPDLLDHPERLDMTLPAQVRSRLWDVVLVDAPAGYDDTKPGRMKSIYAAAHLAAPGGCVFVHDCERPAEDAFTTRYLGQDRLFLERQGRATLRGYAF